MGRDERYMLRGSWRSAIRLLKATVRFYAKWMAQIMMYVTAIHEQVGAVEASWQVLQGPAAKVYAQDVSWTAFRWPKGKTCGTKQTATASALLMSFTNMPMPKPLGPVLCREHVGKHVGPWEFGQLLRLMGQDWSHIFPTPATGDPKEAFRKFQARRLAFCYRRFQVQAELESFSKYCDDWNQRCGERKFPENFPVYVNNPKLLDLSVSV